MGSNTFWTTADSFTIIRVHGQDLLSYERTVDSKIAISADKIAISADLFPPNSGHLTARIRRGEVFLVPAEISYAEYPDDHTLIVAGHPRALLHTPIVPSPVKNARRGSQMKEFSTRPIHG